MKRIMDLHDVAHAWANRTQEEGRTGNGSLFFEDDKIYSYGRHFMIARHVTSPTGQRAVLFTERTYSKTTSAHKTTVRSAANHIRALFVPDPADPAERLFEQWYGQIKLLAAGLTSARKKEKTILQIQQVMARAQAYSDFTGEEMPAWLTEAGTIEDAGQYVELVKREIALREAAEQAKLKARLKVQRRELQKWRAFKRVNLQTADGYDYLRYHEATHRIETTQRVEVPYETARRFYGQILKAVADGGCTNCGQFMDKFDILEITPRFIRVGCHRVTLKEINRMAKHLGWQD